MTDTSMKAASMLDRVHRDVCFENGDHHLEVDTAYSLGADAIRLVEGMAAKRRAQVMHEDAPSAVLGEIGNQIHNIGCELHGNEELQERLACLASRIWDAAKLVSSETPATAANGDDA